MQSADHRTGNVLNGEGDWVAIRLGARSLRSMAATEHNPNLEAQMLAMAEQDGTTCSQA